MEVEDDVFFADLSKRISLLIMDDDEAPVAGFLSNNPSNCTITPFLRADLQKRKQRNRRFYPSLVAAKKEEQARKIHFIQHYQVFSQAA